MLAIFARKTVSFKMRCSGCSKHDYALLGTWLRCIKYGSAALNMALLHSIWLCCIKYGSIALNMAPLRLNIEQTIDTKHQRNFFLQNHNNRIFLLFIQIYALLRFIHTFAVFVASFFARMTFTGRHLFGCSDYGTLLTK